MKKDYLEVMDMALDAYTVEAIDEYIADVEREGLHGHGFPRLTSNIGNLIANGRRRELLPKFIKMMGLCIERVAIDLDGANDFTLSEMCACIDAIAKAEAVPAEVLDSWREGLCKETVYMHKAGSPDEERHNITLFCGVSEFIKMKFGYSPYDIDVIDTQIATQLPHIDENGMYHDPGSPIVYDGAVREQLSMLLFFGYDGKYRDRIDDILREGGLLVLRMQSSSGEIPYGGRSNQFYLNDTTQCIILEYEAARYKREGNLELAAKFKRAANDSLANVRRGLSRKPIRHIKNRFPTETLYGCEFYGYFRKYMITAASFANWAMVVCDESIEPAPAPLTEPDVLILDKFNKVFLRSGDYFAQLDTNADTNYDASGLGRIHRRGAPSELCLSLPGSATSELEFGGVELSDFSIAPGMLKDGVPVFKTRGEYMLTESGTDGECAFADFTVELDGQNITFACEVDGGGVGVKAEADGVAAVMIPVIDFNGEDHSEITVDETGITVKYLGHTCRYGTDGKVTDLGKLAYNRNGHYRLFAVSRDGAVTCRITVD